MAVHEGTGIFWLEDGAGTPVVSLHGFGCDHRLLRPVVEESFAGRPLRRLHLDLPAHGQSAACGATGTDAVVEIVGTFLDDVLGGEPAALLGASFGAGVARGLLARDPGRVSGVAMLAPMVVVDGRQVAPLAPAEVDVDLLASIGDVEARDDFASLTHRQVRATWDLYVRDVLPGATSGDRAAQAVIRSNYEWARRPEDVFDVYDGPVTFVLGRNDPVTGYLDALDLAASYPRATYVLAAGAGHNVHHEAPELTVAALREWSGRILSQPTGAGA